MANREETAAYNAQRVFWREYVVNHLSISELSGIAFDMGFGQVPLGLDVSDIFIRVWGMAKRRGLLRDLCLAIVEIDEERYIMASPV